MSRSKIGRGNKIGIFIFVLCLLSLMLRKKSSLHFGFDITRALFFKFQEDLTEEVLSWTKGFSKQENAIYQLSAYFDNRTGTPMVRVIAASYSQEDIFCFLFRENIHKKIKATIKRWSWFDPKYATLYITCKSPLSSPPHSLSLVLSSDVNDYAFNDSHRYTVPVLPVIVRKQKKDNLQLGVCYQPIHNHGLSHQLMDMHIQVMRALEVDKFIIYYDRDTLSLEHKQLIDYYISQDIVVGVNWKLFAKPKAKTDTIAVWGQFAQIADCYYRFMKDFDYILNLDFDGFPITQNNQTWKEYFSSLSEKNKSELSHIVVPNTYVETQPFQNKSITEMIKIFTSPNTTVMQDCPYQVKYFCDPSKIIWGYVHFPSEVMPGLRSFHLDKSVVRMYHMKTSLVGSIAQCKKKDVNGHQYLANFLRKIKFRY